MLSLKEAARALGGEAYGRQVLAPGPGHSSQDRSLSVGFDDRAPDGILVHSFSGDDWRMCRDHVRAKLGICPTPRAKYLMTRIDRAVGQSALPESANADVAKRTARALAIWNESQHPRGTLVQTYLEQRGLILPGETAAAIRFHPACPFKAGRIPAMVSLVRDVQSNQPRAIHRTALSVDGRKEKVNGSSRLSLGPVGGGAVKLTPDAEVALCLGIGEGIESTLSMQLAPEFGASPVWSLLSAGQMAVFPVLAGIEALWIAVDHDPAGIKAARACAARWQAAGVEVFLLRPRMVGADLNDLAGVCADA